MSSPLDTHWKAVKRILRYLAGSPDYGLHITASDFTLSGFSDSHWASDVDDRRSTSGYCVYFGKNLVSWCAKKQKVVSRSSTEVEYRSLALLIAEISWIKALLHELGCFLPKAPVAWVDNLSTISLASNPVLHSRAKHIELDIHFIRDKISSKEIDLRHVPSFDQVADILTKPLSSQFFARLRNRLGVCSLTSLELRGDVNSSVLTKGASLHALYEQPHSQENTSCIKDSSIICSSSGPSSGPSYKDILMYGKRDTSTKDNSCPYP